jgi:hypothetical protein
MNLDPNTANELGKLLSSEPVKELLGPVSHEVGAFLGDVANMFRFYATENIKKIARKWARNREEKQHPKGQVLDAEDFQRVMPLLTAASMASDDELQERWAALLESAASGEPNYLPSFGQTLSQTTAAEARFLDRLWASVSQPVAVLLNHLPEMRELNEIELLAIYDPELQDNLSPAERQYFADKLSAEQVHRERYLNRIFSSVI